MSNKRQLQTVQNRDYRLSPYARPRGMAGQVSMGIMRPGLFFETLPSLAETRSWVWAAALILALVALSAVRQESFSSATSNDFNTPVVIPGDAASDPFGGGLSSTPPIQPPTTATTDVSKTWSTGLIAASHVVLSWAVITVLLIPISLFNGRSPAFGKNWQIAIWSSLPLALMAGLQLIFMSVGGKPGAIGLTGLLPQWSGYETLAEPWRSLVYSLATRTTIFWVWTLALLFIGARNALRGRWWAATLIVLLWGIIMIFAPVMTGAIKAPETTLPTTDTQFDSFDPATNVGGDTFVDPIVTPEVTPPRLKG